MRPLVRRHPAPKAPAPDPQPEVEVEVVAEEKPKRRLAKKPAKKDS